MNIKTYIKQNKILKQSIIADEVGWSRSAMCRWLKGDIPIPEKHEQAIHEWLKEFHKDLTEFLNKIED